MSGRGSVEAMLTTADIASSIIPNITSTNARAQQAARYTGTQGVCYGVLPKVFQDVREVKAARHHPST